MNDDLIQAKGDRLTADRAMLQLMKRERALCNVDDYGRSVRTGKPAGLSGYIWALRS